ncbi:MAG: hypothetical protein JXQ71_07980 [Verrucomicrobia bacterium]|nr:hypothetical protein [Verrucomicrobiota bacterium]
MNREDAKAILAMYRPGGRDAADPQFAEALALARADAELGAWFARQRAFDTAMSAGVKSMPVPEGLETVLLAHARGLATPVPGWGERLREAIDRLLHTSILPNERFLNAPWWRRWPVRLAAMAIVLGLAAIPVFVHHATSRTSADLLADIVEAGWDVRCHTQFQTRDLIAARQWLAAQGCESRFLLPRGLTRQATLNGVRVLEWRGRKVAFLCFLNGPQHLHFWVADAAILPEAPSKNQLLITDCHGWTTFSWVQDDKIHIFTGLRMQEFIRRFRKNGRWLLDGRPLARWGEQAQF